MTGVGEIHPTIEVALAGKPKEPALVVVSRLLTKGAISEADYEAWDALTKGGRKKPPKPKVRTDDSEPRPKRAYVNRKARCETRPISFHGRFIRRQSLAPTLDYRLSAGCVRTLNYIVARIGKKGIWPTWTVNIAKDLGYCARTIRVHLKTLAEAGYLWRSEPTPTTTDRSSLRSSWPPRCRSSSLSKRARRLLRKNRHLGGIQIPPPTR